MLARACRRYVRIASAPIRGRGPIRIGASAALSDAAHARGLAAERKQAVTRISSRRAPHIMMRAGKL
jgi:hypothetical protein